METYQFWMKITSWYITRYVSINVFVSDFRWFKLGKDAILNIYTSTHCYNYPYLLEFIKNIQIPYIQTTRFMSIQLDSHSSEQMYQHITFNFVSYISTYFHLRWIISIGRLQITWRSIGQHVCSWLETYRSNVRKSRLGI